MNCFVWHVLYILQKALLWRGWNVLLGNERRRGWYMRVLKYRFQNRRRFSCR